MMWSKQCVMRSKQCVMRSKQCVMWSKQCVMWSKQYTILFLLVGRRQNKCIVAERGLVSPPSLFLRTRAQLLPVQSFSRSSSDSVKSSTRRKVSASSSFSSARFKSTLQNIKLSSLNIVIPTFPALATLHQFSCKPALAALRPSLVFYRITLVLLRFLRGQPRLHGSDYFLDRTNIPEAIAVARVKHRARIAR